MGSLFVEVGQCGCQIGSKLNPKLSNSYYCTRNRNPYRLHTIMIDTEPKVIKPYLLNPPKWLDTDNVKYFEHGRGNNWSYGYLHELPQKKINSEHIKNHKQFSHSSGNHMVKRYIEENKKIADFTLERVRKQLQTVDAAMAINVIGSLGGGTGSGLGTKIIELLSEQFNIDIFAHVVLPNMSGQTPLQIYNSSLSLANIQERCDAILPIENEKYLEYFQQNSGNEHFQTHSLDDINEEIATHISKLIKINDIEGYDRFYTDIVSEKVLSQKMNYLSLIVAEENLKKIKGQFWNDCFEDLYKKCRIYNQSFYDFGHLKGKEIEVKREKMLEGELLLVGSEHPCQFKKKYEKKLCQIINPISQQNFKFSQLYSKGTDCSSLILKKEEKQKSSVSKNEAILVSNHSNIVRYLSYLSEGGRLKYENGAYLWHYEYVDIEQALQSIEAVVDQYNFFTHGKL